MHSCVLAQHRHCAPVRTSRRLHAPYASPADFTNFTHDIDGKGLDRGSAQTGRVATGEGYCVCNIEFIKSAVLEPVG